MVGEVETLANSMVVKLGRTAQRRVSRLQVKSEEARWVPVGPFVIVVAEVGNSRNFLEAVETHRPKARVSAVGKAEESEVLRWEL